MAGWPVVGAERAHTEVYRDMHKSMAYVCGTGKSWDGLNACRKCIAKIRCLRYMQLNEKQCCWLDIQAKTIMIEYQSAGPPLKPLRPAPAHRHV